MQAGLYARVSTNDHQTLAMQIRALREYVARRGWAIRNAGARGQLAVERKARKELLEAARRA